VDDLVGRELAGLPGLARGLMNPSVGRILRQPATYKPADPDCKVHSRRESSTLDFTWAGDSGRTTTSEAIGPARGRGQSGVWLVSCRKIAGSE
jgi:hypothetical protein